MPGQYSTLSYIRSLALYGFKLVVFSGRVSLFSPGTDNVNLSGPKFTEICLPLSCEGLK